MNARHAIHQARKLLADRERKLGKSWEQWSPEDALAYALRLEPWHLVITEHMALADRHFPALAPAPRRFMVSMAAGHMAAGGANVAQWEKVLDTWQRAENDLAKTRQPMTPEAFEKRLMEEMLDADDRVAKGDGIGPHVVYHGWRNPETGARERIAVAFYLTGPGGLHASMPQAREMGERIEATEAFFMAEGWFSSKYLAEGVAPHKASDAQEAVFIAGVQRGKPGRVYQATRIGARSLGEFVEWERHEGDMTRWFEEIGS